MKFYMLSNKNLDLMVWSGWILCLRIRIWELPFCKETKSRFSVNKLIRFMQLVSATNTFSLWLDLWVGVCFMRLKISKSNFSLCMSIYLTCFSYWMSLGGLLSPYIEYSSGFYSILFWSSWMWFIPVTPFI